MLSAPLAPTSGLPKQFRYTVDYPQLSASVARAHHAYCFRGFSLPSRALLLSWTISKTLSIYYALRHYTIPLRYSSQTMRSFAIITFET